MVYNLIVIWEKWITGAEALIQDRRRNITHEVKSNAEL